jgi:two-component system sensor histidine kinase MtrB
MSSRFGAAQSRLVRGLAALYGRLSADVRLTGLVDRSRRLVAGLARLPVSHALRRGPVRHVAHNCAALRRGWRRSLQARVVTITLVLSALFVGVFGLVVARWTTSILLDTKDRVARAQVKAGGNYAAGQLQGVTLPDDPALLTTVPAVVAQLTSSSVQSDRVEVVILPPDAAAGLSAQAVAKPHGGAYDVVRSPELAGLRTWVGQRGKVARQFVTANPDGGERRPYLVYGTLVPTNAAVHVELYYLFPLDSEVQAADRVRSMLIVTGVALVALLAGVAWLVTRLVVTPVRLAARTAQRLSAGLLDQRMAVHGEDDLARLAASFNQMAANLQRQIVRLEEMSRLQRRFTSDVSHELRTPLTTVRMAADLIFTARDGFEAAVARSAELLQAELDRFENLLADLLEISRFDAGFAMLEAEPIDLVPVVRRVVDRLRPLAGRAGALLDAVLPEEPVIAEVDPRRVERILRNLIGNAVEHGEGRPVCVRLGVDECAVAVTVRDRGVGLRAGEEKLVFNRFWRADPSRARQTGGTGLGLSISLEDARLHGGWLESWGAPGQGAQFRLTLPVRAGDRLVDSPLPLIPDDVVPATEAMAGAGVEPGDRAAAAGQVPGGGGSPIEAKLAIDGHLVGAESGAGDE